MELVYNKSKPVAVTGMAFPTGDVNNFVVGSEEGTVYTACRHGRWRSAFSASVTLSVGAGVRWPSVCGERLDVFSLGSTGPVLLCSAGEGWELLNFARRCHGCLHGVLAPGSLCSQWGAITAGKVWFLSPFSDIHLKQRWLAPPKCLPLSRDYNGSLDSWLRCSCLSLGKLNQALRDSFVAG